MSIFSDVQALYGSVRGTWEKSQAHILAHVALALVVFVVCGATIPEVAVPKFDAKQITDDEWFKLAKDTGLVYASFVIPVILVAVYGAALRVSSQVLVAIVILVFSPSLRKSRSRLLSVSALEPLALTLKKKNFEFGDLLKKSTELVLKYQSTKSEPWAAYQKSIGDLTKNSQVYLGDFLVFLLAWIILFQLTPQTVWIQANQARFWPVIFVLAVLAWFAGFRVFRAVAAMPSMLLVFTSTMLPADPDIAPLLEIPEKDRADVRQRLEEVLRAEREAVHGRPSLFWFLAYRLGFSRAAGEDRESRLGRGVPFRSLYERGLRFSWDKERHERYDDRWLSDYSAYLYYGLYHRLSNSARILWQLVRYLVTGAP